MRYPGEVWFLPPDAREDGDPKARRHVLLTPCPDEDGGGVLAYASTRGTEAAFGAASLLVDPFSTHYGRSGRTGFDRPTYVYPSRLVGAASEEMTRMVGRLIDEMAELRARLEVALGIGTGTSEGPGRAAGSWRGRVVRFTDGMATEADCRYGLVVTEPSYSHQRRYQLVVPVLDAEEYTSSAGDLVVAGRDWVRRIDPALRSVLLAPDVLQTVFHPTEVERWTGAVADEGTMAEIDEYLMRIFAL